VTLPGAGFGFHQKHAAAKTRSSLAHTIHITLDNELGPPLSLTIAGTPELKLPAPRCEGVVLKEDEHIQIGISAAERFTFSTPVSRTPEMFSCSHFSSTSVPHKTKRTSYASPAQA